MIALAIYIALLLGVGWFIACKRKGWRTRLMIMASVPIGVVLGGFCAGSLCLLFLRLQGRGESHNDMLPLAAAAVVGIIIGGIAMPMAALSLTKCEKNENDAK